MGLMNLFKHQNTQLHGIIYTPMVREFGSLQSFSLNAQTFSSSCYLDYVTEQKKITSILNQVKSLYLNALLLKKKNFQLKIAEPENEILT